MQQQCVLSYALPANGLIVAWTRKPKFGRATPRGGLPHGLKARRPQSTEVPRVWLRGVFRSGSRAGIKRAGSSTAVKDRSARLWATGDFVPTDRPTGRPQPVGRRDAIRDASVHRARDLFLNAPQIRRR